MFTPAFDRIGRNLSRALLGLALAAQLGAHAASPSEASAGLSMLPLASLLVTGSVVGASAAGAADASAQLVVGTGQLVVRGVQASARGTVYVVERVSDGARFSVEVLGRGVQAAGASVGATVVVSVIGAGVILSAAGEVLAFVPNAVGRALLHNERVTL